MSRSTAVHVVSRSDGQWQIERESDLSPLSVHDTSDSAVRAACEVAIREHLGLAIHRRRRPRARGIDEAVRALLLLDDPDGGRRAG